MALPELDQRHTVWLADPAMFDENGIAPAQKFERREGPKPGMQIALGKRKGSKTLEGAAYLFDATVWTEEAARSWLEENRIEFLAFECAYQWSSLAEGATVDERNFDLEIVLPGTWHGKNGPVTLTQAMLSQMMTDTNKLIEMGELQPPASLGHDEDQSPVTKFFSTFFPTDGWPRLGWIEGIYQKGASYYARMRGVSVKFAELVKQGLWHPRSATIKFQHVGKDGTTYPAVLYGVSWLGADAPAVPAFEILGLSDGRLDYVACAVIDEPQVVTLSLGNDGDGTASGGPTAGDVTNEPDGSAELPNDNEPETKKETTMDDKALVELKEQLEAAVAFAEETRKEMIEVQLDRLVEDRRLRPSDKAGQMSVLLSMDLKTAKSHLAFLSEQEQKPDLTKQEGDTKHDETPEKKGGERIIELMEGILADGRATNRRDALVMAYLSAPDAAKDYERVAFPFLGGAAREE